ncbi:MAG: NifU family protein [Chloroflexi bacterium]|nr:NifU family protein [Chloroflexota bacterium]MDA1239970.1 NifU family protein [Chloroflexota bacterium]
MDEVALPTIRFTDEAFAKLSEVLDNHANPVAGLKLQIAERHEGQFRHLLSLVEEGAQDEADIPVETADGITIFVPSHDLKYLEGLEIHYFDDGAGNAGLEFRNPNPIWHDPREFQLQELFDQHINPQIAAHGGVLSLLGVRDRKAYVQFGGGCVGCGMINVTLKQGVEVAVKEMIPDIDEIVDITDHASGENPFYTPAKK